MKKRHKSSGLAIIALIIMLPAAADPGYAEISSLENLSKLVIMEEGRLKPLDTFAQNVLKRFSGRDSFGGKPAVHWLTRVLFTPYESFEDRIFLVANPETLDAIGVKRSGKARDRFSFSQLRSGLPELRNLAVKASKIDAKQRSFIENEIIALYNKLYVFQQLTAGFDFLLPHPDFSILDSSTRAFLGLAGEQTYVSFFDLAEQREKIWNLTASFQDKKPADRTALEKEIFTLSRRLEQWAVFYKELPLTIVPGESAAGKDRGEWLFPWRLAARIVSERNRPAPRELYLMRDFTAAFLAKDQAAFDKALQDFNNLVRQQSRQRIRPDAVSLEIAYNRLNPFYRAKFFYGFSLIFLLLSFLVLRKWFYRFACLLAAAGFLLHLAGVIMRMIIMQRPPVTNLYETFIFTGLMTALLGALLELSGKRNTGLFSGSLSGLVMLMIAGKYALEGDTLGMLTAVLNSNFWLASHVIAIILGYAGIVLSGFIGHVYILQKIFMSGNAEKTGKTLLLKNTFQGVYALQAFGIIFTFLGTVLGGIWADQSWGRFWGWDPKENGALLILLWSAVLFHARLAGWIAETGMAFGSIVGMIAVALAWFGVNLLGVGLHSYGFTSGVARILFAFVAFEILFIVGGLLLLIYRKRKICA